MQLLAIANCYAVFDTFRDMSQLMFLNCSRTGRTGLWAPPIGSPRNALAPHRRRNPSDRALRRIEWFHGSTSGL